MSKLDEFRFLQKTNPAAANRRLLEWLSNDASRSDLYASLDAEGEPLCFQSPADRKESPSDPGDSVYEQNVYLLGGKAHVENAFTETDKFSNSPFHALGGGTFMLALDRGADHTAQRIYAEAKLEIAPVELLTLVTVAFQAGALLSLKQRKFDLAELAELVAARYMGFMFGFAQADHALIQLAMRKAYRGLCYQVMGRHFVSEPGTMIEANAAMAGLLKRAAELIGLYQGDLDSERLAHTRCERCGRLGHEDGIGCAQADETDLLRRELEELRVIALPTNPKLHPLGNFTPLLRRIAACRTGSFTNTEAAVMVVGLIAGAIGNMQASICIAINHFFRLPEGKDLARVQELAQQARLASRGAGPDPQIRACVEEALRRNPPVAFLPRKTLKDIRLGSVDIPAGQVVLMGVGGGTRLAEDTGAYRLPPEAWAQAAEASASAALPQGCPHHAPAALVFGGGEKDPDYLHSCIGQHLAMPLVVHVVRQIMALPGLAEACDPRTGMPARLRKLWGYGCESYPMEFRREDILAQSPLSVFMKIKSPTAEHAEKLKMVIKYGAPSIEKKLMEARHVHFAAFQFLDNDTTLALFTVFDRDFDSYIAHFALEIGSLFDKIFEHIVDAPPLPVDEFPKEFVDTIRRYNRPPAAGYFFSAYPTVDAARITTAFERDFW